MDNRPIPTEKETSQPYEGIVGDYKLLKKIGSGSYGDVWLAESTTGTLRAIKLLYRENFKEDAPFQREVAGIRRFEPISFEHPGFVEIFHAGPNPPEKFFYYVMELADDISTGRDFVPAAYSPKTLASNYRLKPSECVQIGLALADSLNHLHNKKLCHRDIKPSNVIFVRGRPKLADIGLVGVLGKGGSFVGTEGYVAPEGPGASEADIYSFGKLLYQIATGRPLTEFPDLPVDFDSMEQKDVFVELNEVIIKACEEDRTKRYKSAGELYSDLLLIVHGKSIKRLRLLENRVKAAKKVAVTIACGLLLAGAVFYHLFREQSHEAQLIQRQAGAHSANGVVQMNSGDYFSAFKFFTEALSLSSSFTENEELQRIRLGSLLMKSPRLVFMGAVSNMVSSLDFSSDGQELLVGENFGPAYRFDLLKLSSLGIIDPKNKWLEQSILSPNNKWLVMAGAQHPIVIIHLGSGQKWDRSHRFGYISSVEFSPDGEHFVTSNGDGTISVWDLKNGNPVSIFYGHDHMVNYTAWSPDGKLIASASRDKTVRVWDARSGEELMRLQHPDWVYHVGFNSQQTKLVTSCFDKAARVWDLKTGQEILPPLRHKDAVRVSLFSPEGSYLATASWDGTVKLWDPETLLPLGYNNILHHESRVNALSISDDGNRIATATERGVVRIFDLSQQLAPFEKFIEKASPPETSNAKEVARSDNGTFIAVVENSELSEKRIAIHDLENSRCLATFNVPHGCTNFALSDNGNVLAGISGFQVMFWRTNGQFRILHHKGLVSTLALSSNGKWLATAQGRRAYIWDTESRLLKLSPLIHSIGIRNLHFWQDDKILSVCTMDDRITRSSVYLWDLETGKRKHLLTHNDGVFKGVLHQSSGKFLTASEDFTAQVWNFETGERLCPPLEHNHQVKDANFDSTARMVVTGSRDCTTRVWDSNTGEPITIGFNVGLPVSEARFINQRTIQAQVENEIFRVVLPIETMPVEDLEALSKILRPTLQQDLAGEVIVKQWKSLRAKHPSTFKTQ